MSHLLPSELDICDPNFPAKCMAMTGQMRSEMNELVARTKAAIAENRTLMKEIDRWNAQK